MAVAIAVLALVALLAGCGGSSSDANPAEASAEFITAGGKNKIPNFGTEADEDEREAASQVLEENFEARANGDWAKQCATLSASAIKVVKENAALQGVEGGCVKGLKLQGEPLAKTKAIRANTLTGPIDALRIKGARGFALYHGTQGKDYAMPMEKVDGEWKVDALVTQTP